MNPIVLVTRDPDGYAAKAVWFEDEDAFYKGLPSLLMEFSRQRHAWSYESIRMTSVELGMRAAYVIERLESTPWTDMAFAETHAVVSGLLVAVPGGRAA